MASTVRCPECGTKVRLSKSAGGTALCPGCGTKVRLSRSRRANAGGAAGDDCDLVREQALAEAEGHPTSSDTAVARQAERAERWARGERGEGDTADGGDPNGGQKAAT